MESCELQLDVPSGKLWSVTSPSLYNLSLELYAGGEDSIV